MLAGADLSDVRGLTEAQLSGACGDEEAMLPERPVEMWEKLGGFWIRPCRDDEAAEPAAGAEAALPAVSGSAGGASDLAGGP